MNTRANPSGALTAFRRRPRTVGILLVLIAAVCWVVGDGLWSPRHDLRQFDGRRVGTDEAEMWRAYYERRPVRLFAILATSVRTQFHTSAVRGVVIAYHAAKAAFVFKDGRNRDDYEKALPDLTRYFAAIDAGATRHFDVSAATHDELEWWVIRREPQGHDTSDWSRLIAAVAGNLYHVPADSVRRYADLRVQAMVLRDERGGAITDADWARIRALLIEAWSSLADQVRTAPAAVRDSTERG